MQYLIELTPINIDSMYINLGYCMNNDRRLQQKITEQGVYSLNYYQ